MTLDKYQEETDKTATYPKDTVLSALTYTALGCAGEAGELANKVKKIIRGDHKLTFEVRLAILNEIGDVLWYCAQIARTLDASFASIAEANLAKLEKRFKEGKIMGEGDNR